MNNNKIKKYETKLDRLNEIEVAKLVSDYLGAKLKPTPQFFPADFVSEDERIYLEVRCRNCYRHQFMNFLISGTKCINLLRLRFDEMNPTVYLAVAWRDAVGLLEIDFGKVELVPFHRTGSEGTYKSDVMISLPHFELQNHIRWA